MTRRKPHIVEFQEQYYKKKLSHARQQLALNSVKTETGRTEAKISGIHHNRASRGISFGKRQFLNMHHGLPINTYFKEL